MSFVEVPSMNQNIDKITDLIHYTFENRKGLYEFSEIPDYDTLLEQKF